MKSIWQQIFDRNKNQNQKPKDRSQYGLGKKEFKFDSKVFQMKDLTTALPSPPAAINWAPEFKSWPMLDNDTLGNCTIASKLHAIQVWVQQHPPYNPTSKTALSYYEKWCGYVQGDPSTDNGDTIQDVLEKWRQQKLDTHVLAAWADPNPLDVKHIMQSIAFFGGVDIGLQLPVSAQNQDVWDVVNPDGGVWGGHDVYCYGYNETGPICATWDEVKQMTWGFWAKYCDESHCLLGNAWDPSAKLDEITYNNFKSDLGLVAN